MAKQTATIEDIPHELVETPAGATAEIPTVQDTIKNEIRKFNLADSAIAELKKQYGGLKIQDANDTKAYKAVTEALAIVRTKRTSVEKKRKELKASYLETGRAIDAEAARLTVLLEEIETPLTNEKKRIDDEKENARLEKERQEQERLQGRVSALLENGMMFNGSFYSIGETITVDVVTLKQFPDEHFTLLLDKVRAENQKILNAKAEQERLANEERDRIEKQRQEQEAERLRLENERKEMDRQREEMKAQRVELRKQVLINAGFVESNIKDTVHFKTRSSGEIYVNLNTIVDMTGDQWDAKFFEIRADINKLRTMQTEEDDKLAKQKAEDEKKIREQEAERQRTRGRVRELAALFNNQLKHDSAGNLYAEFKVEGGTEYFQAFMGDIVKMDDAAWGTHVNQLRDSWEDLAGRADDYTKAQERKAEEARKAAMSDVERVDAFLLSVTEVMKAAPEVENPEIKKALNDFREDVEGSASGLIGILSAFKK